MGLFPKEAQPARFISLSVSPPVGVVKRVMSFLSAPAVELSICHQQVCELLAPAQGIAHDMGKAPAR